MVEIMLHVAHVTEHAAMLLIGFAAAVHPLSRPIVRSDMHARKLAGGALVLSAVLLTVSFALEIFL